jgi:hypothetical protein
MTNKILFVTRGGEKCDEGLSYVLELAGTLGAGIEILIMSPRQLTTQFEDIMAAAAFAEAGDLNSMKEIMESEQHACRDLIEEKISRIIKSSNEPSVDLSCHISDGDVATAIKAFLKTWKNIDMVLLSPSLSENSKSVDIRKLLKNISKPVVHISKPLASEI